MTDRENAQRDWRRLDRNLGQLLQSPNLSPVFSLWESKCTPSRLPSIEDFGDTEMAEFLDLTSVIEISQDPLRF